MAGIAYVRKRLYNPELLVDPNEVLGDHGWLIKQPDPEGNYHPQYEIRWTGATQAGEELGTAPTSAKDGTTTPFQITVVSSDALDDRDNAAGAVLSVALIGVSVPSIADYNQWVLDPTTTAGKKGKPVSTVEVVAMNGVADVLSTRYYLWVDHIYACEWGTGEDDAEGNITAESPANTNLLVLTAGQNEGEGGRWHFPPDKEVKTNHVSITPTATFAAGDGVILSGTFTSFDQALNTGPDLEVDYFAYTSRGGSISMGQGFDTIARKTTTKSQVIWSEALVANSIVYSLHIVQGMH
jgi:hypothetical protein